MIEAAQYPSFLNTTDIAESSRAREVLLNVPISVGETMPSRLHKAWYRQSLSLDIVD